MLTERKKITERWKTYFEILLNRENTRVRTGDGIPNYGVMRDIIRVEVTRELPWPSGYEL